MLGMLMIITIVAFDVNRSDSCPSLWTMPFLTLIMALKRLIDWIVIIDYNSDDERHHLGWFPIWWEHLLPTFLGTHCAGRPPENNVLKLKITMKMGLVNIIIVMINDYDHRYHPVSLVCPRVASA